MTEWRDSTALWTADESFHAGITRGILQDNASVLGEQAKSTGDAARLRLVEPRDATIPTDEES